MSKGKRNSSSSETWYQEALAAMKRSLMAEPIPVDLNKMRSFLVAERIALPPDTDLLPLRHNFDQWRRNLAKSIMPIAKTDKERDALRMLEYRDAFVKRGWTESKVSQGMSAMRIYIRFLKEVFGGNPDFGLNNLQEPWNMRIRFFNDQFFSSFPNWCREHIGEFDKSYPPKVRSIREFVQGRSINLARSRAGRWYTGSPEIEKSLRAYFQGTKTGSRKSVDAWAARKMICLAEITSLSELLSEHGQSKLAEVERLGKIGSIESSYARSCLRWIFESHRVKYLPYFESRKPKPIFDLSQTPEIAEVISYASRALAICKKKFKPGTISSFVTFCRHLVVTSESKTRADFYRIEPSKFIIALLRAEMRGQSLDVFKRIKLFQMVFTVFLPKQLQWPERGPETYSQFCKRIRASEFFKSSWTGKRFRFADFENCFSNKGVNWGLFFNQLKPLYYRAMQEATPEQDFEVRMEDLVEPYQDRETDADSNENLDREDDELDEEEDEEELFEFGPDDYERTQMYVMELAYGSICRRNKTSVKAPDGEYRTGGLMSRAIASASDLREFESLLAFAVQASGALRFLHEADKIKFWTRSPKMVPTNRTSHRLFWCDIEQCYLLHCSRSRKNKTSYIVPFNGLTDSIIDKWIKIRGQKHNTRLFSRSTHRLTDEIRRHNAKVFAEKHLAKSYEAGEKYRGIGAHQLRHVIRRYVESKYDGPNKELILTVILGHKITRAIKNRSSVAEKYGDSFFYSLPLIRILRRIKSGIFKTDDQIAREKSDAKDEVLHGRTIEALRVVSEKQDESIKISKMSLKAQIWAAYRELSEDERVEMAKEISQEASLLPSNED